ncbi:MAG: diacylglycerol kinase family protein [Eggerthellaceae bacterium]|nr:diacylglycerol kinase family protein [Eggerthellaceae bacterium]
MRVALGVLRASVRAQRNRGFVTRAKFVKSFGYAFEGIAEAFREGRNFKVQLCFAVAAVVLGLALAIDPVEWAVVAVCIGVVLGGECANTSIEAIVDLVSPEYNDLAKRAKDCAAGAVLVCSIASLFVAAFIFLPRIIALLSAMIS